MTKQLRIDFPDYPAKEQERDANKKPLLKVIRHAYLMKIDGEWAHFIVTKKGDDYKFYGDKSLTDVYYELKKNYPDYKPRVLKNEGLENYLRDQKKKKRIVYEMQSLFKETPRE